MDNAGVDTIYQDAADALQQGTAAALVLITGAVGHTPQVVGARMLVYADGSIAGTVGGGRFEFEIIERAKALAGQTGSQLIQLNLGAELGMCCGGVMEALVTPLSEATTWLQELEQARQQSPLLWIKTNLNEGQLGERQFQSHGPALGGKRRFAYAGVTEEVAGTRWLYERLESSPRLVLFGAGHVAQPTAKLAQQIGYRVCVIDSRVDWNTEERFPDAQERIVAPYEDALEDFTFEPTDALVIVTHGHDFDQFILEAVLDVPSSYLGMIGSKSKVHKALLKLRAQGISEERYAHLHAPIGLGIGALTPEEIAVSIAAELIQQRRLPVSRETAST